jgi:hypothetical protein
MKPSSADIRQKAMNKARPDRFSKPVRSPGLLDRFKRNEELVASSNPARVPTPGRVRQHLPFIRIKFVNFKKD